MRYLLLITILLSVAMPVWAQGDDEPPYTIDSEGWLVTSGSNNEIFYTNNEDIEVDPENDLSVIPSLKSDDLVVKIEIEFAENEQPNVFPTDPVLYLGVRLGLYVFYQSFYNFSTAEGVIFSDVETATFDNLEFHSASLTTKGVGVITTYIYVTEEYTVFFDIYYTEDTDIEPAIELLETFELQISD